MGDGSYFDYESPETSQMTIEDVAYGLAYTVRFRGQNRARLLGNKRVFYSVAEHCTRMAWQLLVDGHGRVNAYAALMHELGEVPWGDMPGPAKTLSPEFKAHEKRSQAALEARFGVEMPDPVLIKRYDLRMLATEKRDLMPHSDTDEWTWVDGYQPLPFTIVPFEHPDMAAEEFLEMYGRLAR